MSKVIVIYNIPEEHLDLVVSMVPCIVTDGTVVIPFDCFDDIYEDVLEFNDYKVVTL
jgi:hypothetical protein